MTIALVERFWHGHHPAYYKSFCAVSLNLGYDTLAICPFPEEIPRLGGSDASAPLEVLKFDPPRRGLRPRRFQARLNSFLEYRWLNRTLREWEKTHGRRISLVFFACIYDVEFRFFPRTASGFPWPWSGLYVHCNAFRMPGKPIGYGNIVPDPKRIFRHRNLQSLAILDEGAVDYALGITRGRPVTVFPDFHDEVTPAPGGIAEDMRRFAAGRPIVGLLGHLHPTKGVSTLARIALDPANNDIVFAFVGELMESVFSLEDRQILRRLASAPNVFLHLKNVPDDAAFNGVVQACDVLFAAYHDFPHSSNILTKAAAFRKPILVSDGYLMAERVRRYALGEVVPEKNIPLAAAAMRKILANKPAWLENSKPQWDAYCAANSRDSLKQAFARLVGTQ